MFSRLRYSLNFIRKYERAYGNDILETQLNAKELILAKINAGTDLSRCYLHLIMMGFNIKDIAAFMTSPVVSIVSELATANMFDEYMFKVNIDQAINMLRGKFLLSKFFSGSYIDWETGLRQSNVSNIKNILSKSLTSKLHDLGYTSVKDVTEGTETIQIIVPKEYLNINEIMADYMQERIEGRINESLIDFIPGAVEGTLRYNNSIAFSDFVDNVINKIKEARKKLSRNEFDQDLNEFEKVYNLATETSTLGSAFLGFNQGIAVIKAELSSKVLKMQKAVTDREKLFGITLDIVLNSDSKQLNSIISVLLDNNPFLTAWEIEDALRKAARLNIINNFDFYSWIYDKDGYREATSKYYNIIKGTWNIFDMIDKSPQYHAIFECLKTALTLDLALLRKSQIVNMMVLDLFDNNDYVSEDDISGLLEYTDKLLIIRWLRLKGFRVPIMPGDTIFSFNWDDSKKHNGEKGDYISMLEEHDRGTFKKIFEEQLYPSLKQGIYEDLDDENNIIIKTIGDNKFIKNLTFDVTEEGLHFLKLKMDMQNTNATPNVESRYQECLSDFIKLKNFEWGPVLKNGKKLKLSDWFMIYNLIVNLNKFGSDRLTTIFGQFVGVIKEDSIIKSFLLDTGELDFIEKGIPENIQDLEEWGYNREDAFLAIAPLISTALEANTNYKRIREYEKGIIITKKRSKYGEYGPSQKLIGDTTKSELSPEDSKVDLIIRQLNYNDYSTLSTPFATKRSSAITNLSSSDLDLVLSALRDYMQKGIIEIETINC